MKNILCAIPARAGSKRLPEKNIRQLHGKPMIAYSIEAARAIFETVYVCTESESIASVAQEYGATVPVLAPEDLCDDLMPSHAPCTYIIEYLMQQRNFNIEAFVLLQPTSPLRSVDDIKAGLERFQQGDVDFVVSVTFIDPHYFHWALQPPDQDAGRPYWKMYFEQQYMIERPLLPPVYRPNGSIKIAKLEALKSAGHFFGERLGIVETPEERSIHVATQVDFDLCEYFLSRLSS